MFREIGIQVGLKIAAIDILSESLEIWNCEWVDNDRTERFQVLYGLFGQGLDLRVARRRVDIRPEYADAHTRNPFLSKYFV